MSPKKISVEALHEVIYAEHEVPKRLGMFFSRNKINRLTHDSLIAFRQGDLFVIVAERSQKCLDLISLLSGGPDAPQGLDFLNLPCSGLFQSMTIELSTAVWPVFINGAQVTYKAGTRLVEPQGRALTLQLKPNGRKD